MKKILLTTLLLSLSIAFYAEEVIKVQFDLIANPTGDPENPFPLYVAYGQELWGDYNNDGKLDRLIIGGHGSGNVSLYRNEGSYFSKVDVQFFPLAAATAVFIDYDNDGNLDILTAGKDVSSYIDEEDGGKEKQRNDSKNELWRNLGEAGGYAFEKDVTFTLGGICDHEYQSRCNYMAAADYDNDGWTDIFIIGHIDGDWHAKLFRNDEGFFEEVEIPVNDAMGRRPFSQIAKGSIQTADLNNDGYVDVILSGEDVVNENKTTTTVFFNNGDGTFSEIEDNTVFEGQDRGTTFAADIDNDGWMDIVEMGDNNETGRNIGDGRKRVANIYLNNKDNTFAAAIRAETSGLLEMRAMPSVGDVNNDGYVDILAMEGWEGDYTHLFYNNGDITFSSEFIPSEYNGRDGVASIVDFNGDGMLDISIEGWCGDWHNVLLINEGAAGMAEPQAPTAPENFTVTQAEDAVVLSWDKSTDDTTPQEAIRYNIFIQAKEAESDGYQYTYCYAPADISTGFLKWTGKPHFISGTTITMNGFNVNDYVFGVQAVDNGWLASAFSTPKEISNTTAITHENIIVSTGNNRISLKNAEGCSYSVFNAGGQAIAKNKPGNSITNVPDGIYIVKITGLNNNTFTRKVIVL